MEDLIGAPAKWTVTQTGTNTQVQVSRAGVAGSEHYVQGVSISANSAANQGSLVTLQDGASTIDQWEIPAAAFSPIIVNFPKSIRITAGNAVTLTIPALGPGVTAALTIRGFTAS